MSMVSDLHSPAPMPIPKHRQIRNNYFFDYSIKRGDYVEFESELEWRFWGREEGSPHIGYLCHQPYKINERVNGKKLIYTFDLWTRHVNSQEIYWEVKGSDLLISNEKGELVPNKWDLIEKWALIHEADVRFITEIELDKDKVFIDNWLELLRMVGPSSPPINKELEDRIFDSLDDEGSRSWRDIVRTFYQYSVEDVQASIVRLLHSGRIDAQLRNRHVTLETPLRKCHA